MQSWTILLSLVGACSYLASSGMAEDKSQAGNDITKNGGGMAEKSQGDTYSKPINAGVEIQKALMASEITSKPSSSNGGFVPGASLNHGGWYPGASSTPAGWYPGAFSAQTGWYPGVSSTQAGWNSGASSTHAGLYPGAPSTQAGWYPGASGSLERRYPGGYAGSLNKYYGPIAVPVVLSDGTIADTPEVAAARAAHLSALEKAKALWFGKYDDGSYNPYKYGDNAYGVGASHGGIYNAPHSGSRSTANTGEAAYLSGLAESNDAALWRVKSSGAYGSTGASVVYNTPYNGPLAWPTLLPSGYLADTPEVAAAKGSHLVALAEAQAAAALWKSSYGSKNWS